MTSEKKLPDPFTHRCLVADDDLDVIGAGLLHLRYQFAITEAEEPGLHVLWLTQVGWNALGDLGGRHDEDPEDDG